MRSLWKIPFINYNYFKKCFTKKYLFTIKYKNSIIGPNFIDKKVNIYSGKTFSVLDVSSQMIGFKFGEFIPFKISASYRHLKKKDKSKRYRKK